MHEPLTRCAAIDIGSNSIRLLIAEAETGAPFRTLASEREVTRLGESVFRTGKVSAEGMERVRVFLLKARGLCAAWKVSRLRAVATAALRDAENQQEFLARAEEALGAPVEIISGEEEGRLIHLGVKLRGPDPGGRCLVIDIGGGSAELMVSRDGLLQQVHSLPLGALRLQGMYMKSDPPLPAELSRLTGCIDDQLRLLPDFENFDRVIGTSATASAVVAAISGEDKSEVSVGQVRELYQMLTGLDVQGRRMIPGIGPQRAEIIIPGCAVLLRILERAQAATFHYSVAAVRDGLIAELLGA